MKYRTCLGSLGLLILLMACQDMPSQPTKTMRVGGLSCFSIAEHDNSIGPSCDDLCAGKGAACMAEESAVNLHDCGLPTSGMGFCRCCALQGL